MATSLLSLIIMGFSLSINLSHADPRTDLVARTCGNQQVRNVSNYFKYFSSITDFMQDEIYRNLFAFKDVGKPPDRLYVLAQCMDDLSNDECAMCFAQLSTLIPACFPSTGGRVYFNGCFIRAENYSFYREALSPQDTKICSDDANNGEEFKVAVKKVLDKLMIRAPNARGFAMARETSKGISAYGMASCCKTLDSDLCSTCLSVAATSALSCLPSVEAHVLNAGCFLRYTPDAFANRNFHWETQESIYSYITYILAGVAACILSIGIGVCVGKHTYRKKINRLNKSKEMEDMQLGERLQFLQFKYATLQTATENFDDAHRLGQGGFGEVFKGTLPDGREIAIKRLFVTRQNQIQEVFNEMDIIGSAHHKNLVRFLGCCFTSMDSFLVYEYLANRSLNLILFDPAKKQELDWKKRFNIIIGLADGLKYIHKDCRVRIIHRDIKASNVLLDLKHRPKISDFGLARFYNCDESLINTAIAGTLGYIAPEYIAKGRLTDKVDVYSFGVLVIEIVTGVENNIFQSETTHETLVINAWKQFQSKTVQEIIDKSIEYEDIKEIERVVQIGLLCTQESPIQRPNMTSVVQMLRHKDTELPTPSKPPFTDVEMGLSYFGLNQ